MKTTVEIPDDLFTLAKKRAAELRQPLRALFERGLRAELAQASSHRRAKLPAIRWMTVAGGGEDLRSAVRSVRTRRRSH